MDSCDSWFVVHVPVHVCTSFVNSRTFMLHVFDGVLAPSTSRYLHTASSLGELGDELHTVFLRDSPPKTAIESCLQSLLHELNDPSPCVE